MARPALRRRRRGSGRRRVVRRRRRWRVAITVVRVPENPAFARRSWRPGPLLGWVDGRRRAAHVRDPALGAAGRAATGGDRSVAADHRRQPRGVHLHRRGADRDPAEPDRPRVHALRAPAVARRVHRLRPVRRRDRQHGRDRRHRRRRPGQLRIEHRRGGVQHSARRRRDAGRGAHRPSAGLARLPRPGAGQGARPGQPGDRPDPLDRSPGVHGQGGGHRPGRGDRRVREPVQRRAGDRHLDLHAARRRPAVPVPAQPLPRRRPVRRSDRPVREGADRVRPRAGHGVAGDRGDRGRRLLDPGRDRASSRTATTTPSPSARGRR